MIYVYTNEEITYHITEYKPNFLTGFYFHVYLAPNGWISHPNKFINMFSASLVPPMTKLCVHLSATLNDSDSFTLPITLGNLVRIIPDLIQSSTVFINKIHISNSKAFTVHSWIVHYAAAMHFISFGLKSLLSAWNCSLFIKAGIRYQHFNGCRRRMGMLMRIGMDVKSNGRLQSWSEAPKQVGYIHNFE